MTAVNPGASQQAVVEAALVLLERMGLSPADLAAVPQPRKPVPTFAEYVPVVSAAVSDGTRRAYGSYWNRIVEHWGSRRLDEPTPSEIRQLMAYVKTHVVARRNARGGRSAEEHLVAALRCLYQRAVDDGLIAEAGNPARKVAKPRRLPSTRRAVPDTRLAEINEAAATTGDDPELDTLLLRLHTETACRRGGALALRPRRPGPGPVPDPAAGKGRDGPLAAGLAHLDGPPDRARPASAMPRRTGSCCGMPSGRPITSRRYDHPLAALGIGAVIALVAYQAGYLRRDRLRAAGQEIRRVAAKGIEAFGSATDAYSKARQALRVIEPYGTPTVEELAARHLARVRRPLPLDDLAAALAAAGHAVTSAELRDATSRHPAFRTRGSQPALISIGRIARLGTAGIVSQVTPRDDSGAAVTDDAEAAEPQVPTVPLPAETLVMDGDRAATSLGDGFMPLPAGARIDSAR